MTFLPLDDRALLYCTVSYCDLTLDSAPPMSDICTGCYTDGHLWVTAIQFVSVSSAPQCGHDGDLNSA